jgi:hypothetical protein
MIKKRFTPFRVIATIAALVMVCIGMALGIASMELFIDCPYPFPSNLIINTLILCLVLASMGLFFVVGGIVLLIDAHLDPRGIHHG